ncbi:acyl-CoA-binding domain-containing protein 4 isoform X2 [Chanodichthys erythropterus]|uniref:acyl-CoA-binding domain-containing protein 4 isoform X2 n=1 Tax=Chanodichthys erythropterus TaxID=933992 RepID=UPI00351F5E0B
MNIQQQKCGKDRDRMICQLLQCQRPRTFKGAFRRLSTSFKACPKMAVCGPCTASRPGFWDPIGRYKWDAWNQLGDMNRESAMAAYVDEMKKVAQEVIDTMQINEKTASFFHYFEPLYHVIHDMPRPPEALLSLRSERATQERTLQQEDTVTVPDNELQPESTEPLLFEGQGLTSDSESDVFCDSLEQLDIIKLAEMPGGNYNFQNSHAAYMTILETEISGIQEHHYSPLSQVTQMGAGHGDEGAEDRHVPPMRRRTAEREGMQQDWRDPSGYMAHRNARWPERLSSGAGSGQGGGDDSKGGPNRLQDSQVEQQIILALQQLREDMQSVRERLEVVEGLATANAQHSQWRSHLRFTVAEAEEKWWPFDFSGRTLLLLLVWPFVTQGLMFLLRRKKRKIHVCI